VASTIKAATPVGEGAWPRPAYAWYVVIVLAVANLFAAVDRAILNLLLPPIKADFALSDTELGLIQGAAFGLIHTLTILPFGWLADRAARNRIVTFGIAFWSLMTAGCGLARNFAQLFVARMAVGVGEASLSGSVAPLISDYFPREKRTLPLSVYAVVGGTGNSIALLAGGALSVLIIHGGVWRFPIVGELRPWQTIFLAVGLPGLLWALVTLTVTEPLRHRGEVISHAELMRFLRQRANIIVPHFFGNCCFTIFAYGAGAWMPTLLMRVYGWSMADTGYSLGLISLFCVLTGGTCGGLASQWFFRRGRQDANLLTVSIGIAVLSVPGALLAFMPSGTAVLVGWIPISFFNIFQAGPSTAAMQEIAPSRLRGRVAALYYATTGLLGLSFGAVLIGLLTDRVFRDPTAVAKSISLAAVILCPLGALSVALASRGRRALEPIRDS
jgi:MFS family permease